MKTIASLLLGLSLLAGIAAPVAAADCTVKGWVETGQGGRPVWDCPDKN